MIGGSIAAIAPAQAANKVIPAYQVDTSETRVTGHNVFSGGVVRVYTEGATSTDKAAGYFDVHDYIALCKAHYEKVGIGAGYVETLFR